MVWATWLADAARMTGYPVIEVSGWERRGSSGGRALNAVEGVVLHHTAGAKTGNYPSYNVVLKGRTGLSGPLSQLGLARDGSIYVFGAGRANHAGESFWAGFSNLNGYFIGIEAESVGYGQDWTQAQKDAYPRLVAAILHYIRRNGGRAGGHREVGLPKGRKTDPAGFNMNEVRSLVDSYLANPSAIRRGGAVQVEPDRIFKPGERVLRNTVPQLSGPDVEVVQKWAGAKADGFYGPNTAKLVADKQRSAGLEADGVAGPKTWEYILSRGDELDMDRTELKNAVREVLAEDGVKKSFAETLLEYPVKSEYDGTIHPFKRFVSLTSKRVIDLLQRK